MSRRLLSRSKPNFALCYATFFLTLCNENYDDSALMDLFGYLSGACVLVLKKKISVWNTRLCPPSSTEHNCALQSSENPTSSEKSASRTFNFSLFSPTLDSQYVFSRAYPLYGYPPYPSWCPARSYILNARFEKVQI